MKGLLKYLSPFAPDQSGAVAVFYELGGITVICDAGGCTGNICGFDEPRWFQGKSALFSAGLRDMDAILGRDDRLVEKLKDAANRLGGNFAALIGTPVPAVIATDFRALKRMAAKRCGMPVMTVECTGTRLYDEGEEEAYLELFRTFAEKNKFAIEKVSELQRSDLLPDNGKQGVYEKGNVFSDFEKRKTDEADMHMPQKKETYAVGVIGMTPLDISHLDAGKIIEKRLQAQGVDEVYCYGMGASIGAGLPAALDAVKHAGAVRKNLVVSPAGVKAAKYLEETFGTPYEPAFPFLKEDFKEKLHTLSGKKVLIIHQQVAANVIREEIRRGEREKVLKTVREDVVEKADGKLRGTNPSPDGFRGKCEFGVANMEAGRENKIICGTWFLQIPEWKEPQDVHFEREESFISYVEQEKFDVMIGDGMFQRALGGFHGEFISIPHFAVSGSLFMEEEI